MHTVLHWLPSEQRITYRLAALIWRCLLGLAPVYLQELCGTILSAGGSRSLRSFEQGLIQVPFARTSIRQNRAFSVLGPSSLRPGIGSLWSYVFSRGLSHLCSFLVFKPFSFAALRFGVPLSRFLEEVL